MAAPQPVNPSPPPSADATPPTRARAHALWWLTAVFLIIGGAWAAYWYFDLRFRESTDDAYANGDMITINSAIPGSVVAFFADDTDLVEEGQLLVQLDTTYYQVEYDKALASLAEVVLHVRQLYDQVQVNRANIENKRAVWAKANFDYQNRLRLVDSQAVSNEDFIHAKDDLLIAETDLKQAEEQLKVSLDAVGNTSLETHPLIEQQKALVRAAFYNLKHCAIFAPAHGYVAQRSVEVGSHVTPLTALMAVIPTTHMWVDANFKETQLTHMRVGQPATVWFDLYGSDVKFEGKVLGIASGTGSVFSIIPPQNATGNWIKIVQRLPVRISLDAELLKKYPARLGLSAEVDVDITNRDLPYLAQTPSTKAIATTNVFELDFAEVNTLIEKIIKVNGYMLGQEQDNKNGMNQLGWNEEGSKSI